MVVNAIAGFIFRARWRPLTTRPRPTNSRKSASKSIPDSISTPFASSASLFGVSPPAVEIDDAAPHSHSRSSTGKKHRKYASRRVGCGLKGLASRPRIFSIMTGPSSVSHWLVDLSGPALAGLGCGMRSRVEASRPCGRRGSDLILDLRYASIFFLLSVFLLSVFFCSLIYALLSGIAFQSITSARWYAGTAGWRFLTLAVLVCTAARSGVCPPPTSQAVFEPRVPSTLPGCQG